MKVELIAETNVDPIVLSSHAAKKCYTAENPTLGQLIDVNARLFTPGHHTTLQHNYFTFSLEDVPVSACVLITWLRINISAIPKIVVIRNTASTIQKMDIRLCFR